MNNRQKKKAILLARVEPERKRDGCWLQTSHIKKDTGYGVIYMNGKKIYAHQLSYEIYYGKIPSGMHIHHDCDNRNCVNPGHFKAIKPGDHPKIHAMRGCYRGERNRRGRYSNQDIKNLKHLADAGISRERLTEIFPMSRHYIAQILRGHRRAKG